MIKFLLIRKQGNGRSSCGVPSRTLPCATPIRNSQDSAPSPRTRPLLANVPSHRPGNLLGSALDLVELLLEFAQRDLQDLPDYFQIETEIVVDDAVAQASDLSPGNADILKLKVLR